MELNKAHVSVAALALLFAVEMRGEFFSARDWKLDSDVSAGVGYDSNLTLINGGPSSAFYQAAANFKASRKGGRHGAEVGAGVVATAFDEESQKDQIDANGLLRYEYSKGIYDRPSAFTEIRFNNSRSPNTSVGERIVVQDLRASGAMDVANSGVGVLNVGFDASRRHYVGNRFDTNSRAAVNGSVTLNPTSLLRYAVGGYVGAAQSKPNQANRITRKSRFVGLTGRVDGQITAAVRGVLFAGGQYVELRSGVRDDRLVPVAGGMLTWNPSINQSVRASVDMGESFAADGSWTEYQRLRLAFEQRLYRKWLATVQVTPAKSKFVRTADTRSDDEIGAGVSLAYVPSERFSVTGSFDYATQDSNELRYDFSRRQYYLSAVFRW